MIETFLSPFHQGLLFTGVLLVVGCVAWRVGVAPGAMRLLAGAHTPAMVEVERRMAWTGVAAALVISCAWVVRMVDQVIRFRDPFVPLWEDVSFLLFETFWGTVWMAQGVLAPVVAIAFWRAAVHRGKLRGVELGPPESRAGTMPWPWWAAMVLMIALVATLALSSHAMGAESWMPLIVTADAVHTLAAGIWIGALALIVTVGRPDRDTSSRVELFAAQIRSYSPMALVSVTALLSMGIVLAWTHLTTASDLWTTTYGRILSAKLALTLGVLAAGFVNWRQGIPTLGTESGSRATSRRAALEVTMAAGVLLITALLVHSVLP